MKNLRKTLFFMACASFCSFLGCGDDAGSIVGLKCVPGDQVCKDGVARVCVGTDWNEVTCPAGCDDAGRLCLVPENAECVMDICHETRKDTLKRCVGGKVQLEKCPPGSPVCSGMKCVAEEHGCTENDVRCSAGLTGTEICKGGTWMADKTCQPGEMCENNQCVAGTADECTPGTMKCADEYSYNACNDDGMWETIKTPCDSAKPVCAGEDGAARCVPAEGECEPNTLKCASKEASPNTYYRCGTDRKWETTENRCDEEMPVCSGDPGAASCVPSEETMECTPSETRCTKDKLGMQVCSSAGHWMDAETCPNKMICDSEKNACACNSGDINCTDTGDFQICRDGAFETVAQCGVRDACLTEGAFKGCSCNAGSVVSRGETKCSSDSETLMTCTSATEGTIVYNYWGKNGLCTAGLCQRREQGRLCRMYGWRQTLCRH